MLAQDLKKHIYENDLLPILLEKLKFHNIRKVKSKGEEWIHCSWEDGDNPSAVQLKCDENNIFVRTYTHTQITGDIFSLVMYLSNTTFVEALKEICQLLDIEFKKQVIKEDKEEKKDILSPLKKYKRKRKSGYNITSYPKVVLDNYSPYLHTYWYKEGIRPSIASKFNIGFDWNTKRITIPYFSLEAGEDAILGVEGRTLYSHEICSQLRIPKYFPLLHYEKSKALFGYTQNYNDIQKAGYVVLCEGAKSVLRRASWGDNTCVALGGHYISDYQLRAILGMSVDIILALDKDEKITQKDIDHLCGRFHKYRNVYYIPTDELEEKQSPQDLSNEEYLKLLDKKIKYKGI